MFPAARLFRPVFRSGIVFSLVFAAALTATTAARAQPTFTQPGLQQVTVTKTFRGGDNGYDFHAGSSGADLLSISQLILKLTRELLDLVDSDHGSGGGSSGEPSQRDFELVRKLAQLRQAVQQRRQLQMAQVLEQAVEEMAREEEKQGKEPTRQEAEEAVRKTEQKIEQQRVQLDPFEVEEPAPPPAQPPPSTPQNGAPSNATEQASDNREPGQRTPEEQKLLTVLNRIFEDNPEFRPHWDPETPGGMIQFLKELKQTLLDKSKDRPTAATTAKAISELFDPVIEQREKDLESGTVWLDVAAKLFEAEPTTQAQLAEDKAQAAQRKEFKQLDDKLVQDSRTLRQARRVYNQDSSDANREAYQKALQARNETQNQMNALKGK